MLIIEIALGFVLGNVILGVANGVLIRVQQRKLRQYHEAFLKRISAGAGDATAKST